MLSFNQEQFAQIIEQILKEKLASELSIFKERVLREVEAVKANNPSEDLVTRKELAGILGVSIQTLIEWDKKGFVKPKRFGSRVRYSLKEVFDSGPF